MSSPAVRDEPEPSAAPREPEPPAAKPPLRARVLRGSVVTIVGHFAGNAIRLGSNLILTRLLMPEHFGVMALVNVILLGLHMFSDIGIGPSVIQHEHGDEPRFAHTAFSIQAIRGVWLTVAACLLAWPMASFYELPELLWMIPAAGLTALIDGFTSTKVFRENRHLHLGRVTAIEVCTQIASAITMAIAALITRSVVALLLGGIAAAIVRVVLSHTWLPGFRDGFAWDPEARKALVSFGRWIFVSTAITFVAMQIDRLALGRLVEPEVLGVYSIAGMLAAVPREVLGQLSQRVLYPLVAEMVRTDPSGSSIRTLRVRVLALLVVPLAVAIGESQAVFEILYDARYEAGGPLMAILCIGTWLNVIATTYGVVVLAKGWPKWISFGTACKAIVFAAGVVPVNRAFGVAGVALLIAISELSVATFAAIGARGAHATTAAIDLTLSALVIALGGAVYVAQRSLTAATGTSIAGVLFFGVLAAAVPVLGARRMGLLRRGGA